MADEADLGLGQRVSTLMRFHYYITEVDSDPAYYCSLDITSSVIHGECITW